MLFRSDPAQFLDDPEPQPTPNPKPKTKPQPKPKTKPKPKPKPKPETEIPAELLAVDGFAAAWGKWEKHHRERGNKLTPTTKAAQLEKAVLMLGLGVDVVAVIARSTEQGYTGLFWDNAKPQTTQPQPQAKSAQKALYEEVLVDYYDSIGALDDNGELLPPWETNPKKGKAKSSPKPALVLTNTDDADLPF